MAGFEDAGNKPLPHFLGHRERLKERFRDAGADSLPDYELLEMLLFRAIKRGDTKPIAKQLLARFGTFAEVLSAEPERLMEVRGVGEGVGVGVGVGVGEGVGVLKSSSNRLGLWLTCGSCDCFA